MQNPDSGLNNRSELAPESDSDQEQEQNQVQNQVQTPLIPQGPRKIAAKIVCLSDGSWDAAASLRPLAEPVFDDEFIVSAGNHILTRKLVFGNGDTVSLLLWVVKGFAHAGLIAPEYFEGARGIIFGCSTGSNGIDKLDEWLSKVYNSAGPVPTVVLLLSEKPDAAVKPDAGQIYEKASAAVRRISLSKMVPISLLKSEPGKPDVVDEALVMLTSLAIGPKHG